MPNVPTNITPQLSGDCEDLLHEVEALNQRVKPGGDFYAEAEQIDELWSALQKALVPFANMGALLSPEIADDYVFVEVRGKDPTDLPHVLRARDLRAAYRALIATINQTITYDHSPSSDR